MILLGAKMSQTWCLSGISLPRNRPEHVKSLALQVISLAHYAMNVKWDAWNEGSPGELSCSCSNQAFDSPGPAHRGDGFRRDVVYPSFWITSRPLRPKTLPSQR